MLKETRILMSHHSNLIAPGSTFSLTADKPERLDKYLARHFPLYSRSFFAHIISKELVQINGKQINKAGALVKPHDVITVTFPQGQPTPSVDYTHYDFGVNVIYMHNHFLVINKPAGLMVHKPTHPTHQPTLVDWIVQSHKEIACVGSVDRPGIIHRLDKDTSGLLLIARTQYAHTAFGQMFKDRSIQKTYRAIVHGHPPVTGTIDMPLGRHPVKRITMTTFTHEQQALKPRAIRNALTHYKVLQYFDNYSLVELKPVTGRTHQLRVHMAAIGHPLVGDAVYGSPSHLIKRHALHAYSMSFTFDGSPHSFTQEVPADFQELLQLIK
jgi:23S rRNA pseudouridine1911/1915/1917 synthase